MKTMKLLTLMMGLTLTSSLAFGFDCREASKKAPNGTTWKECKKTNRKGSDIKELLLTRSGDFYAYIPKTSQKLCQIAPNVVDFKASAHPNDAAVAYYIQNGDLYYVSAERAFDGGNCPRANKAKLMANIKKDGSDYKYSVVSNTNTTIVNVALDTSGNLLAWPNAGRPVYSDVLVIDYLMNQCFGTAGKSYSSFVMFTKDAFGTIGKVKGNSSGSGYIKDGVVAGYSSLSRFSSEQLCK